MNSIASYIWPSSIFSTGLITGLPTGLPIHVCQDNRGRIPTFMSWALRPFGLYNIPMEVTIRNEKTIIRIVSDQSRIVDGVICFSDFSKKLFRMSIPLKIETEGTKTVMTMEVTNWMFCDCDYKKAQQVHFKLREEDKRVSSNNGEADQQVNQEATNSLDLIKEFFELSDAEESFLERQGSIRRSDTIEEEEEEEDLHSNSSNSSIPQAYSHEEQGKYEEDEDIQQLESHLNNSIRKAVRVEKDKNFWEILNGCNPTH